ncbi:MAG: glycosyltransferase [Enhydrobacter sp.]|nr:glycosyltransferase [Enhydrobacter sp.]
MRKFWSSTAALVAQADGVRRKVIAGAIPRVWPRIAERACHRAGLDDTLFAAPARDFDMAHYQRFAGERFASKEAAIFHYLMTGSPQGWEPNAGFSPAYYRHANPDTAFAGYEPFAHYCRFGRYEGRAGIAETDSAIDRVLSPPPLRQILARPRPRKDEARIDVVIPVYGNRRLALRTIDSVLAAEVRVPFELIVVDDASPDPGLAADLKELAEKGLVSLLVNGSNLGFVQSANRGLLLHQDRDVVLLNSDTHVFGDWLDRLVAVLHATARFATATPLSNAATILSYPIPLRENSIDLDYGALDRICARTDAKPVELPTGVGFCMAIKRECINQIGGFDTAAFGRGYGEENDFCRRAAAKGWRHAAATNVFVWHKGGGSFAEQRERLLASAQLVLERRHPGYGTLVVDFIAIDPLWPVRALLDAARVAADPRTRILRLGATTDSDFSQRGALTVQIVPDIGPFWGTYRPRVSQLPGVANLPRISRHAPVSELARVLSDLRIDKLAASPEVPYTALCNENWIAAARECGVAVV